MNKRLFFVFDVESVGLHGEGYAYGFVVVDEDGNELCNGFRSCSPDCASGDESGRAWIEANCPKPHITDNSTRCIRLRFAQDWLRWKSRGALMAADCAWPVEANFLVACVRDGMDGPYPLIDVGSIVLAAGGDPIGTFDRLEHKGELPKHDPLCYARQSARILIEHLRSIPQR